MSRKHPEDKPYAAEASYTKAVMKLLDSYGPDLFYEKISDRFKKGMPDIWGCYKGKFFMIELKKATGTPSGAQENTIYRAQRAGGQAIISKTIAEVKRMLEYLENQS